MSAYIYRPLSIGEIRIFRLSPGHFHEALAGKLVVYSTDVGIPTYKALSYVWGAEISPNPLQILPKGSLSITSNLDCALRYLRSSSSEVSFWVDAVCINQNDSVEKGQQVARMRDVYAIASEVVAFLGDKDPVLEGDLGFAARVSEDGAAAIKNVSLGMFDTASPMDSSDGSSPWSALFGILLRPWFSRIWVVQEALVARKLSFQCGSASVAAHKLAQIFSRLDSSETGEFAVKSAARADWGTTLRGVRFIRKVASRQLVAAHTKQKTDLLELLWVHRGYKASKARDHLFAVLGLANAPFNSLLSPDYESCLEVVVNRYAQYFVQFGTNPMRLLYSAGGICGDNRFESWIPNWTLEEGASPSLNHISHPFLEPPSGFYSTALFKPPNIRIGRANQALTVTGSIFSYLTAVGEDHWNTSDHEIALEVRARRYLACVRESDYFIHRVSRYPTSEKIEDVQTRLLVGNRARRADLSYQSLPENYAEKYSRFRTALEDALEVSDSFPIKKFVTNAKGKEKTTIYPRAFAAVSDLRLCLTKNGYLGLVPQATEIGDAICIVHGSCVPFVLRPCKDVKGAFRVVGKCYVHGIMEGEAMRMKDLVQSEITLV